MLRKKRRTYAERRKWGQSDFDMHRARTRTARKRLENLFELKRRVDLDLRNAESTQAIEAKKRELGHVNQEIELVTARLKQLDAQARAQTSGRIGLPSTE